VIHKLGVHSQLEAVATAARTGLLHRSMAEPGEVAPYRDAFRSPQPPIAPRGRRPVVGG
jgi:hypothetical protein